MAALPQSGDQLPVLRGLRVGPGTASRLAGTIAPVTDRATLMSMFDYDARPVTPLLTLVSGTTSRRAYAIRDFLSRNGYPFEWADAGQPEAVRAVLGVAEVEPSALPLCILQDGSRLASATVEQVAAGLGMVAAPSRSEYDLTIVGAGPGLSGAVNAASEGLRTVVIEAVAPGGQAGTTSMIENYLGVPNGISGSELATRAVVQARRFGAELLLARPLVDVSADGPGYVAELSDGTLIRWRAVLFASGVEWRRLDVPGVDDLLDARVDYGAAPSEALACTGSQVVVVGGGNSARQAVVRFSRYAKRVTLLVRGRDLGASMPPYPGRAGRRIRAGRRPRAPSAERTAARGCPRTGPAAQRPQPRPPRRGRAGECGQREVPEREPHVPAKLAFDLLDRVERLP